MRLGAVTNENAQPCFSPQQCVSRAERLGEELVKEGFIKPNFSLLKKRLAAYTDALEIAYKGRRDEKDLAVYFDPEKKRELRQRLKSEDPQVSKAAYDELERLRDETDLSRDVLTRIKSFIDAKNEFFGVACGLIPELTEKARRLHVEQTIAEKPRSPGGDTFFNPIEWFLEHCTSESEDLEDGVLDQEQELSKDLEKHKSHNYDAERIHVALIDSKRAENNFLERLRAGLDNSARL